MGYGNRFSGVGVGNVCYNQIAFLSREIKVVWFCIPQEIPQQNNGSDCGVFVCKFADFISRDKPIIFTSVRGGGNGSTHVGVPGKLHSSWGRG